MRLDDAKGTSHPPILTDDMLETVRNLVQTKAARKTVIRNAEMEEMRRRQAKMKEELMMKISEYEEAMCVANECAQIFEQFMASHMNQDFGGGDQEDEEDEDDEEEVD